MLPFLSASDHHILLEPYHCCQEMTLSKPSYIVEPLNKISLKLSIVFDCYFILFDISSYYGVTTHIVC